MKDWKAIVEKQAEYIKLLGEELDGVVPIAHVHGWRSKLADKGAKIREELSLLESQEVEEITDKNIYEYINNIEYYQFDSFWDAVVFGAKAMRDRVIKKS